MEVINKMHLYRLIYS